MLGLLIVNKVLDKICAFVCFLLVKGGCQMILNSSAEKSHLCEFRYNKIVLSKISLYLVVIIK